MLRSTYILNQHHIINMTSKLISTHTTKKCMRCGEPLKSFVAYIPNLGETCMKCYIECAINDEKTLIH
jgi:hypothetical protein